MNPSFQTTVVKKHATLEARVTQVHTPHGDFMTPTFMPVATRAAMNCMTIPEIQASGSQIILGGNTYHMLVAPGTDFIAKAGGMHRLMHWSGPMLTDSGGFQVYSLSKNPKICTITEEGARFKHPIHGHSIALSPQISMETQKIIGADIIMAFDHCMTEVTGRGPVEQAMQRTHRWLQTCVDIHQKNPYSPYGHRQALFGIIQGGSWRDLREASTMFMRELPLDGIALGGESIGPPMQRAGEVIDWVVPLLPPQQTRYAMGIGSNPQDVIDIVAKGIDIFDCVAPTRNARHGALLAGKLEKTAAGWLAYHPAENQGRLLIKKAAYASDQRPVVEDCDCYTCLHHSRSYLHFLFKTNAPLYAPLACTHNVRMMQRTCEMIRDIILSPDSNQAA